MATASKEEISDVFIEDIRSCWKVPAIAHFCSLFRSTFSLPDFEIEELEEALFLDAGVEQSDFIINLVVQLLCGIHGRKDISSENYLKWLRCVMKKRWELGENRVNPLNSEDVTFKVLPTLTKVEILHALCDYRLDAADVSVLKDYDGDNLRVEPLGTDRSGATYWYFYGTRLYKEDREPTQEEREVKRKQKLKEKRKRRRERLKAVKKMKELRKKQKQKDRGMKGKGKKKKKKVAKTSDEESNSESFNSKHQLETIHNNRKKSLKKEPVRRAVSSQVKSGTTDKPSRVTKSKKQIDTSTGVPQGKTKTNDKSSNETTRKESPKKSVTRKKKESSANSLKQKTQSKKRSLEVSKSKGKDVIKSKTKTPKEHTSSSTKTGNKDSKEKNLQNKPSTKTRKRKVIKSKAIISESEKSDEEDQPLKKVARSKTSHRDIKVTLNQQKLNKKDSQSASKIDQHKGNRTKGKSNNNKSEDGQQANAKKERKKKLPMNVKTQEEVKQLSSEDDISSVLSTIESSDSDSEDDIESPRWHLVCHTQEDWQKLTEFFKKSKVKCEKELYKTLANDFLPEIQSLFAAKEKALRKRLQELEPRRASSRVVIMQLKREEDERMKSIEEAEQSSMRLKAEEEKREKMKLRNKLQEQSTNKSGGCPDKAQTKKCKGKAKKTKKTHDGIDMKLQQVFDAVNAHEDSWPFSDPVDEAYAPAYYQIIIKPMCLALIQKKLNKKEYKTKDEFERDMNQLFTNCLEYNGPGNEYTLMAENLKSCLEYNMEQVFVKQAVYNEDEDSGDETQASEQYHRPPQRQSARNANTRLEKLEDKVYARLRGLSSSESSILESNNSSEMMSDEDDGLQPDNKELKSSDDQEEIVKEDPKEGPLDHQDIDSKGSSPLSISDHHSYDSNDNKAYEACSSKSEDCNSDNGRDVQTSDGESAQPSQLSSSRLDKQKEIWASKPVGVIAFAPGVSMPNVLQPAENEDTKNDQRPSSGAQESVHSQIQTSSINTTEVERKENPGQYLNTQSQGPSTITKVNRVKPIQNVSPYVPDTQSEKTKQILAPPSHDQYQRTQPMAQGLQPMIDLNLNRPDVLKPLTPSTNETPKHGDMAFHKQNTVQVNSGLNHVLPQGNLYQPSSLNQVSDDNHSKQFSYSGSSIKQKRNKPINAPELPAPLTVLPDRHVNHESSIRVPAVQPLLPSSNYTMQATHHEQVANMRSNAFKQSDLIADYKANNAAESNMCHDPSLKLWHPLGSEDKMTSSTSEKTHQSSPHTITKSNQLYPHQVKLLPAGHNQHLQSSSGNILESLLHKQSHVSEYQHSGEITNHSKLPSTSAMYMENKNRDNTTSQEQQFTSKHPMQPRLVTHDNVEYHESHGQCQPHKQQTDYRSSQPFAYSKQNFQSQTNCIKTYMTSGNTHSQQGNVKLYHNPVNAVTTNPSQSVARQPDKSLREVAKQHKVTSTPLYAHTSSMQSATVDQTGYDNVGSYLGKPRSAETILPSRNNSLSMLSNEQRNMKEYMDLERANQAQSISELNKGYLPAGFNQGHTSSLYTDHLRMHASQAAAAAASYGYPAASRLILPSRQMTSDQSTSAFTPHDPYSRQSAFRMQRPSHSFYPQYMQEADQLARQQYQQHMHHRAAGLGAGGLYQTPRPTRTHPDMAFYTQHGIGNAVLSSKPSSSVGAPLPHDPSLLSRSSHMSGYK